MPNVNAVINEQIRRLARREIRSNTKSVKRAGSQSRHAIAGLRQLVAELSKRLARVERHGGAGAAGATAAPEVKEGARFRAMGVRSHRSKLGLSAAEYAKLVGVSPLTIYHWEHGKARPRNETLSKWLAIRSLGKREVMSQLGHEPPRRGRPAKVKKVDGRRQRGSFKQTGQEAILSLLKDHEPLRTSEINDAWRKEGRGGSADVMLGLLVKSKKLKRTKVEGQRGSEYRLA